MISPICKCHVAIISLAFWSINPAAGAADEQLKGDSISFSDIEWKVKSSAKRVGPGPNYFSRENVWIDDQGRLHLKVSCRKDDEGNLRWDCAEIVSKAAFNHGTYRWYVSTAIKQDPNVVLGLFTWDNTSSEDHHREIDIELISTWGSKESDQNAQYVVQPWTVKANRHRFHLEPQPTNTTHMFTWKTNSVDFLSLAGHGRKPGPGVTLLHEWTYTGPNIPKAGAENARMNLWLLKRPTEEGEATEVIISKFEFEPEDEATPSRSTTPVIEFASIPSSDLKPGPAGIGRVSGKVSGANPDDKVVVYARGGDNWYVQPLAAAPKSSFNKDGSWVTDSHGGTEYAALLVKKDYIPAPVLEKLPAIEGDVLAVARKKPE